MTESLTNASGLPLVRRNEVLQALEFSQDEREYLLQLVQKDLEREAGSVVSAFRQQRVEYRLRMLEKLQRSL